MRFVIWDDALLGAKNSDSEIYLFNAATNNFYSSDEDEHFESSRDRRCFLS